MALEFVRLRGQICNLVGGVTLHPEIQPPVPIYNEILIIPAEAYQILPIICELPKRLVRAFDVVDGVARHYVLVQRSSLVDLPSTLPRQ